MMDVATGVNTTLSTTSTTSSFTQVDSMDLIVARTTILAFILLLGFLTNLILVITVACNASLRSVPFHCHVVSVSVSHLMTSILILPLVIGYSVTGSWDYGEAVCHAAAHLLLTITAATCLGMLVMNLDRVIAIYDPTRYSRRISLGKTAAIIVCAWMTAILFPLPVGLASYYSTIKVSSFDHRFICSIDAKSSMDYLISFYFICFAAPAIAGALFFVYIAREALSEREAQSTGAQRHSLSRLWPEAQAAGIVFVIFLCWSFTELPYITLSSVHQYTLSDVMDDSASFEIAPALDTGFVWLKFCDTFLMPLFVFALRKEIWSKFKDLVLCRKSNSVVDASPRPANAEPSRRQQGNNSQPVQASYNPKSVAAFKAPTIRATRQGLHVHGDVESDDDIFYADMDLTGKSSAFNQLDTRADIERLPGLEAYEMSTRVAELEGGDDNDTSDYETDPYSRSDPISVRSAAGQSGQAPAGGEDASSADFRAKAHSMSHDSGNGSASSSVKKKKGKKRKVADGVLAAADSRQHVSQKYCFDSAEEGQSPPLVETNVDEATRQERRSGSKVSPRAESGEAEARETESQSTRRRKKKKNKNREIADAETNTSSVFVGEAPGRRAPPPRLDPLPSTLTGVATPPLRSKYPRDQHRADNSQLPPSGGSSIRRKARSSRADAAAAAAAASEEVEPVHRQSDSANPDADSQRKKRKSRPRKVSGDSNKPLMSSNTSSEMHSVADAAFPSPQQH